MTKQRRRHGAGFKARVALEAAKGQKTIAELAAQFRLHPTQVTQWKQLLLGHVADVFAEGRARGAKEEEALRAELYQKIGRLEMELEWLKKKVGAES
jgi:transposase-like protein